MTHKQEKKKSIETLPEVAQMLDLLGKDFNSAVINKLRELKETMSKELKESTRTISHQIESISKIDRNYCKSIK